MKGLVVLSFIVASIWITCNKPSSSGEQLYKTHCGNCHMDDGKGLGTLIPPVAGADFFIEKRDSLACLIVLGQSGKLTVNSQEYDFFMPPHEHLTTVEITNILNYINQKWHKNQPDFILADVKKQLEDCGN